LLVRAVALGLDVGDVDLRGEALVSVEGVA
jgi:hypothetical protein